MTNQLPLDQIDVPLSLLQHPSALRRVNIEVLNTFYRHILTKIQLSVARELQPWALQLNIPQIILQHLPYPAELDSSTLTLDNQMHTESLLCGSCLSPCSILLVLLSSWNYRNCHRLISVTKYFFCLSVSALNPLQSFTDKPRITTLSGPRSCSASRFKVQRKAQTFLSLVP